MKQPWDRQIPIRTRKEPPAREQKTTNRNPIMTHRIITLAALTLALSSGSLSAGSTREKPTGKFYETPAIHINGHPTIKEGLHRNLPSVPQSAPHSWR